MLFRIVVLIQLISFILCNNQFIIDKDASSGVRPLIGITSVIDCPPDEHFN